LAYFLQKIVENIKILSSYRTSDADDAEHIFWPIIDSSSLYATRVTRGQGVVLRRVDGRGHFRSRDKDGGHTIRSAVAENPLLYANVTALSSTEPQLLPIDFFWHCGNREFCVFLRKIVENIKIFRSYRTSNADDAETHFLVHFRQFHLVCCRSYTHARCCFTPNRSRDKDGGHTIRSAVAANPLLYANVTSLSFIELQLLPIEDLHCGNREFCAFLQK